MKVRLDISKYSTAGRISCRVLVQWMKGQPRTVNPSLFECHVCLGCVCVWVGGGMGEGDLRPPSPVICKSYEL